MEDFKILTRKNKEKQEKAGVTHIKIKANILVGSCSDRIKELSTPVRVKAARAADLPESRGLLNIDYIEALNAYTSKDSQTDVFLTSKRSGAFPLTDFQKRASSKPGEIHVSMRPFTASSSRVKSAKTSADFYNKEESNEIEEGMQALNEFDKRYGNLKGRVGFPQIYLEKFKKKDDH